MILPERLNDYLDGLEGEDSAFLEDLKASARAEKVPIITDQVQSFLKVLLLMQRPERILEIGTGVGFSALMMAEVTASSCRITTIENYPGRIAAARENLTRSGKGDRIDLLCGDARDLLPGLKERFDFVFLDAAKGQYLYWLPQILRLMRSGAVLVADDVLQDGSIYAPRSRTEPRKRTIYDRMRGFLHLIKHTDGLQTSIVPIGDGVSVTVKQQDPIRLEVPSYD